MADVNRIRAWIGNNREEAKSIIEKTLGAYINGLNKEREKLYFEGAGDTSQVAKYRKKTNTQRTKERDSYKRGSEFGGTRIEQVIHNEPMMMSGITFQEVMGSFVQGSRVKFIEPEDLDRITRKILEKNGNRGRMPNGYEYKGSKWKKAFNNMKNRFMEAIERDGF